MEFEKKFYETEVDGVKMRFEETTTEARVEKLTEENSEEVTVVFSEDIQPFPGAKPGVDYYIREFEYTIRVPKNHKGPFVLGQPKLPEDFYTSDKYIKK